MTALLYLAEDLGWAARGQPLIPYVATPPPDPDPEDPPPAPASWQAAVDAMDVTQAVLWYEAYSGHDGINPADPFDMPLQVQDLTGTGAGIDSQYDGEVIEGKVASRFRIRHNNVTIRRCRIVPSPTTIYAVQLYPTTGTTFTGCVVEFCTVAASNTEAAPFMLRPALTDSTAVTVRHNDVFGTITGGRLENRCVAEYNFFHDFGHPPGGHASGIRFMGAHGIARRNLLTDSSSSNLGMYLDQGFMHSVTYEGNIVGGTITMPDGRVISPQASPSYGMILGMGDGSTLEPYDLKILDNYWYGGYQFGLTSGNIPWGVDGNVRSGNRALQTFTVQPGSASNERTYLAGELLPFNDQ
ncbi:hypothetical protein SAMN05216184_10484 [Georgenia satyanarayanai]|uniref:Right handed beta helix region n=1 Tax=Georgenia satyanarayanai TaxID=860221 RepID=A0A2Y9A826_9MICO|nr:hypothetical protein [Georgenia satyanarayanai]PYG00145.1 hypothetical protein A8987_10484 [Georgenia satyanarayanai]SSA40345.1 hypothetical protein SAMN05216184_10484 [Georgenia satyanarayanai]